MTNQVALAENQIDSWRKRVEINKKSILAVIISLVAFGMIILIGPADYFTHGYYCNELDYDIVVADITSTYNFESNGTFEMLFSPKSNHFVGFEINLVNQPANNSGTMKMEIQSKQGKVIDIIEVDLSKVQEAVWYKTYTKAELRKGTTYKLLISTENCVTVPHLQLITPGYLEENVEGNLLIGYAYAKPTFTFQNKVLFIMFIISGWLYVLTQLLEWKTVRSFISYLASGIFIIALLSWNFMYNSMDKGNDIYYEFQSDSESLVKGMIEAEKNGSWFCEQYYSGVWSSEYVKFGLGTYESYVTEPTDNEWFKGYSRHEAAILVSANGYSRQFAIIGNYIKFENGDCFKITNTLDDGINLVIYLEADRNLNPYKFGSLKNAYYCDENQVEVMILNNGIASPYQASYGLQGKIFRHLARYMDEEQLYMNLYMLCCLALGTVVSIIIILLYKKYNMLLAVIFLITFWLSPWVVSFARNLYWVEFTWFLPMAIGLFCSLNVDKRLCRIISYIATFFAIVLKCLCGYEYISTIMMGLISFLLVDFIVSCIQKQKARSILLFRTIIVIGIIALLGFVVALCIHAPLRGNGNVLDGIKVIFEEDVLRRTSGADLNKFSEVFWASFNASVWETCAKYFRFSTEIIVGIAGNLFPLLCIIPVAIFMFDIKNRKADYELMAMYFIFFLTSISWFVLAKGHSYIHTHMNYVLWYFGYVQICLYIIVNKIGSVFRIEKKTDRRVWRGR